MVIIQAGTVLGLCEKVERPRPLCPSCVQAPSSIHDTVHWGVSFHGVACVPPPICVCMWCMCLLSPVPTWWHHTCTWARCPGQQQQCCGASHTPCEVGIFTVTCHCSQDTPSCLHTAPQEWCGNSICPHQAMHTDMCVHFCVPCLHANGGGQEHLKSWRLSTRFPGRGSPLFPSPPISCFSRQAPTPLHACSGSPGWQKEPPLPDHWHAPSGCLSHRWHHLLLHRCPSVHLSQPVCFSQWLVFEFPHLLIMHLLWALLLCVPTCCSGRDTKLLSRVWALG